MLWNNVKTFSDAMADVLENGSTSPIVPIIVGENEAALAAAAQLEQKGYFVPAIRYPTVPLGQARLRVTLSASHTEEKIIGLADELLRLIKS